ncbi:hypothetical protein PR048_022885 [Dryococelus australis]|uniref:Uncharacterized protein n=1 Tax=Dryococelus australis TaxID=614101 RepID=A0ABQ9GSL4_9NEOP|nr:hypothetical protein PR048_022885 [Dryococelus australis]
MVQFQDRSLKFLEIPKYLGTAQQVMIKRRLDKAQRAALIAITKPYRTMLNDDFLILVGSLKELARRRSPNQAERKEFRQQVLAVWQEIWNTSTKGRETHQIFPDVTDSLKKKWININRYITQILTRHENFKAKLDVFKLVPSSMCVVCEQPDIA